MTILQSVILGIVQGITEFLPISSSGHLVLTKYVLGWNFPNQEAFIFDVLVQVGTLVAVIIYFWRDLEEIGRCFLRDLWARRPFDSLQARLGWYLLLASVPAGLMGILIRTAVESAFVNPVATALFLLGTALLLIIAERLGNRVRSIEHVTWRDAIVVGVFQVLALFPGVSRSGATITGGMVRNLNRPAAARFSFLMSVPIMLAAGGLAVLDLFETPQAMELLPPLLAGFVTAAAAGYLAIHWLLRFLSRGSLYVFAAYCTGLSMLILLLAGSASPPTAGPPPTRQLVRVALSSGAVSLTDELRACASTLPDITLDVSETPTGAFDPGQADLLIRLGPADPLPAFAFSLSQEAVLVIVNPDNPVARLEAEEARRLFEADITRWDELGGLPEPVHVWTYVEGDEVRRTFGVALLSPGSPPDLTYPSAYLAPSPGAMLEAVGSDGQAIGYLPGGWLDSSVKVVELDPGLAESLHLPVLALAARQPRGAALSLLGCLQDTSGDAGGK